MHVCPRCRRANPDIATFCYYDGAELRSAHPDEYVLAEDYDQLPREFAFPSGRRCNTYDDMIRFAQEEWSGACEMLRQGTFQLFLSSIGRMDLVQLARQALTQNDIDMALSTFLAGLPATLPRNPRLQLDPHKFILGTLQVGETRTLRLRVINQGLGVLQGTLSLVEETVGPGKWLYLTDDVGGDQFGIYTATEQQIPLQLDTAGLPTGRKYAAELTLITNGGAVEVPVRMELAAQPFPRPPFQGSRTPRELADRMRRQPKAAVALLESGAVAHWFAANGWPYPVQGALARGVAAVQQFFECMGLSKPPRLQLSEAEVRMTPVHPEVVRWEVTLLTDSKKWVFAHVDTDVPWLKVLTPEVSGPQQAPFAFEVDSSLLEPNRFYAAQVNVTANAGQTLAVQVRVDVQGKRGLFARKSKRSD